MMKKVVIDNIEYIVVKPVKSLFKSDLIYDVVARGDFFVVNTKTGELTVKTIDSDYTIDEWTIYLYNKYNSKVKRLPNSYKETKEELSKLSSNKDHLYIAINKKNLSDIRIFDLVDVNALNKIKYFYRRVCNEI